MKNIVARCPLTIQYIMGINVMVYLLWKYHDNKNNSQFMIKNFTLSKDNHKRPWTWITSHFSHKRLSHLLVNLFAFSISGTKSLQILGVKRFLSFLGITSFLSSFISSLFKGDNTISSLGMSSITSALAVFDANANPTTLFTGYDLSIITYSQVLQSLIIADFIGLILTKLFNFNDGIDHGMHIAGYSIGFLYINFICSKTGSKYFNKKCRSRLCQ